MSGKQPVPLVYHGPLQYGERWPGEFGDECPAALLERIRMRGRAQQVRRKDGDLAGRHPTFGDCLRSFEEAGPARLAPSTCAICGVAAVDVDGVPGRTKFFHDPVKHRAAGVQPTSEMDAEEFLPTQRTG
jgi:hypothetical protein